MCELERPIEKLYWFILNLNVISKHLWNHEYFLCQFPHSAFALGPRSPAFGERMRAAMGATGERSAGRPHTQSGMCFDSY